MTPPQEVSITHWGNTKINLILNTKRTGVPEAGISARRCASPKSKNEATPINNSDSNIQFLFVDWKEKYPIWKMQ